MLTENLTVILVATRNPLNIGAVALAMSNFGVAQLRVVRPYEKAFREAQAKGEIPADLEIEKVLAALTGH